MTSRLCRTYLFVEATDALELARHKLIQAHLKAAEDLDPTVKTAVSRHGKHSTEVKTLQPIPEDKVMRVPNPGTLDVSSSSSLSLLPHHGYLTYDP